MPSVDGDPIFTETASSLSLPSHQSMDTVRLSNFTEAFVNGDTTSWFKRMLLLDHIESVQDLLSRWMDSIESQLDGMSLCIHIIITLKLSTLVI